MEWHKKDDTCQSESRLGPVGGYGGRGACLSGTSSYNSWEQRPPRSPGLVPIPPDSLFTSHLPFLTCDSSFHDSPGSREFHSTLPQRSPNPSSSKTPRGQTFFFFLLSFFLPFSAADTSLTHGKIQVLCYTSSGKHYFLFVKDDDTLSSCTSEWGQEALVAKENDTQCNYS